MMIPSVQFKAVQVVMQSETLRPRLEYETRYEAIRKRIRGDVEVFGYDREVHEAAKREIGDGPDTRTLYQQVEEKHKAFLAQKKQENSDNPNYQGLLFTRGFFPNPLQPESKSLQALYIDGDDISRFSQAMAQQLFSPMNDLGFYEDGRSVRRVDTKRLTQTTSIADKLVTEWSQECVAAYQAGQTQKLIDLDA